MLTVIAPYLLIVFIIVILQYGKNLDEARTKKKLLLAFLILFLFAGFRGNGDGDYFTYLRYSTLITSFDSVLNFNFPMEIGFRLIAYFVNATKIHQQFVIIIMNAISIICIGVFINRHSSDKMLSVFLFLPFYFQFDMHAARTAVAISISILSFKYIVNRKFIKFVLVICLAAAFHSVAFIMIPIFFLKNMKIDVTSGIITIVSVTIITALISVSKAFYAILCFFRMNDIAARYLHYMGSEAYGYNFSLLDLRLLIAIFLYITAKNIITNANENENMLINLTWMSTIIMIFFREHTVFVTRISAFFTIYMIILIPIIMARIVSNIDNNSNISYRQKHNTSKDYYLANAFVILFFTTYMSVYLFRYSVQYRFFVN
jgi:hypothetical protein